MDMATWAEQGAQVVKDTTNRTGIDVMEKAVHKDKIKRVLSGNLIVNRICDHKLAAEPFSSERDIVRIQINAQVIGMREQMCVCTWAASYIQNTVDAT